MRLGKYLVSAALLLVCISALIVISADGEARTCTWDGGDAGALASSAANWDLDTAPIASDNILFDGANDDSCTWDLATNSFGTFSIAAGYTGTITYAIDWYVSQWSQAGGTVSGDGTHYIHCFGNASKTGGTATITSFMICMDGDGTIISGIGGKAIKISANVSGSFACRGLLVDPLCTFTILTDSSIYCYNGFIGINNDGTIAGDHVLRLMLFDTSSGCLNYDIGNIECSTLWIDDGGINGNRIFPVSEDFNARSLKMTVAHATYTITLDMNGSNCNVTTIVLGTRCIFQCGEGDIYASGLTSTLGTVTPETAVWHFANNSLITMAAGGELYDVIVNGTALRLGSDVKMHSLAFQGLTVSHPYGLYYGTARNATVSTDANGSYSLGSGTFAWDSAEFKITPVVMPSAEWTHDDGSNTTDTYVDYHYWLMFVSDYELGTTWTLTGADWLLLYDDGMIAGRSSVPGNFTYTINATGSNGEIGSYTGYVLVHEFLPDPDWPDNPGTGVTIDTPVLFVLSDVEVTLWDMYDPYYIEVTNDTLNIATVAGEFPMTYWSTGMVDVNVTTFKPYTNTFFVASLSGAGDDLDLRFGGFQPGSTFTVIIDGVTSTVTADGAGYIFISIENIISTTLSISYLHTAPVFTTSPDIVANEMVWYTYDANVYPSNAVVTIEELPYWLYWDENAYSLVGLPRDLGSFEVRIKAVNAYGISWQNWTIYIYTNEIGFTSSPDLNLDKFDLYEYEVDFYPPNAVCKVLLIPTWLHFNEYTDTLKGTALKAGSYNVVIRITLGHAVAYQNFTITVNDVSDPSWLDHDMSIDAGTLLFYILIGGAVVFMMIVFYIKRM